MAPASLCPKNINIASLCYALDTPLIYDTKFILINAKRRLWIHLKSHLEMGPMRVGRDSQDVQRTFGGIYLILGHQSPVMYIHSKVRLKRVSVAHDPRPKEPPIKELGIP